MTHRRTWIAALGFSCCLSGLHAQVATLQGHVEVTGAAIRPSRKPLPSTVVWLVPVASNAAPLVSSGSSVQKLVQKNKSFEPHILVVSAGSAVEFPNHDPFFHNVFSLFEGKRFDLG